MHSHYFSIASVSLDKKVIAAAILLLFGIGWVIFNVIAPNEFANMEVAEALQEYWNSLE